MSGKGSGIICHFSTTNNIYMGNVKRHGDYEAFLERHAKETTGKNTDELYTPPHRV